ncbi:hypothetical protein ACFPTY_07930 [Halomonas beimenensis]|uniref:Uncharacterized protein n=1 Tax=Halomonas beimenensis TaxID=475662 RepID=A0A291P7R8_9GAMM|nr:hypothetical protein [Halomonas beimenensis]ATJ82917.1 hypothetical protein BEI_1930 [Halomonas beimenensis]
MSPSPRRVSRLKLLALFGVFVLPMAMAWGMVEWRLGIPEARTAHGRLDPAVPPLAAWPVQGVRKAGDEDWLLAFDCPAACASEADRWWRLHRALGREAHRLSRLRIGGSGAPLPGAAAAAWRELPPWRSPGRLWVVDPEGRAVLEYPAGVPADQVLADIERLLELNPASPLVRREAITEESADGH